MTKALVSEREFTGKKSYKKTAGCMQYNLVRPVAGFFASIIGLFILPLY